ncbi:TonB-dependent receptor [Massilia putida]|uniref:TonB-dependent receptor n=1 Tax=Massilia putida TaxID=1141883 RepID=UPI0009516FFD|nr:TonB-dependent receptor [Massilia putida]
MNQKHHVGPRMSLVALALAQAFATQAMAQQAPAETNTVLVTGIRASAQSSLAVKRNSMEVVDSISAEDIGKLPDPNVEETLTRVPGVQGYRYGGEGASPSGNGSGLTIRGLSGQTASQVNGRASFTAGSREFNLEDAIPGMIAGVDVYKNPSAEHIEGGIGGLVNIRTRKPSDFKGPTASISTNARYNDLAKKVDPELFGLFANRYDLGGGSRIGVMAAFAFQKSTGRSDSNPANRGPDFRRVIGADTPEYAQLAAANTGNNPGQPMAKYVGRNDVGYLAPVTMRPTSATVGANTPDTSILTPAQAANIISTTAVNANLFQETIMRQRRGLNLAADYRVDNTLRFYAESNYTGYLYHQNYRFVWADTGNNLRNLQTAPFAVTESMVNRNFNGGSDDVLSSRRLLGGTWQDSAIRLWGGDEHSPYTTWIAAGGAEWNPTSALFLKADFSYIKSDRRQDNRRVEMAGAAGLAWDVTRYADGEPHKMTYGGPSLSDPKNFVFSGFPLGWQHWDDKGNATALDGAYTLESGFFDKIKFGTRYATQQSQYTNRGNFWSLTTDGKPLAADRSNAIPVPSKTDMLQTSPTNYMRGLAGYSGGYIVWNPDRLLGNQVKEQFPASNMPDQDNFPENVAARRFMKESTLAGYLVGDFSAFDESLKGNVGVRVVRTRSTAVAKNRDTTQPGTPLVDYSRTTTYTNVLPTFNATYDLAKDFLARFGFGRGMTRPDLGSLNPSIAYDAGLGTANIGNPDLRPQTADSYDFSLERYFSATNFVSAAVFDKQIKGFFSPVAQCMTVPFAPLYSGATSNGCTNGQYLTSKQVNAAPGYARGVEVAGQWFFGGDNWWKNFGVAGNYTYVKTSNPVNYGTPAAPVWITSQQPYTSKNSYSISGLYEDNKLSGRLVYTWRSSQLLGAVNPINPLGSGYVGAYGLLDASLNYAIDDRLTLSLNASNLTDKAPNRYVGEAPYFEPSLLGQYFDNGRNISVGLRYKF